MDSPQVGIGAIIVRGGKVLFGHRKGKHGKNTWSPPGGKLEGGESFEDCAKRETFEETGLKIPSFKMIGVTNDLFDEGDHYVTVWMQGDWREGEAKVKEPHKMDSWEWFEWNELPTPLFKSVTNFLEKRAE